MVNLKGKMRPILMLVAFIGGVFLVFFGSAKKPAVGIRIKMPELSVVAGDGREIFQNNCSQCHGVNAGGTKQGPPLIHKFYEPSHHGDGAFFRAATMGVRAHHWRFGNMPPIRTVTTSDVRKIVAFVREVQRANGIF